MLQRCYRRRRRRRCSCRRRCSFVATRSPTNCRTTRHFSLSLRLQDCCCSCFRRVYIACCAAFLCLRLCERLIDYCAHNTPPPASNHPPIPLPPPPPLLPPRSPIRTSRGSAIRLSLIPSSAAHSIRLAPLHPDFNTDQPRYDGPCHGRYTPETRTATRPRPDSSSTTLHKHLPTRHSGPYTQQTPPLLLARSASSVATA